MFRRREKKLGINRFDKIYYISYDKDRIWNIEDVLNNLDCDFKKVKRIDSISDDDYFENHLIALRDARQNGYKNVLILEDNFIAYNDFIFNESIDKLFNSDIDWDIISMCGNVASSEDVNSEFLIRVLQGDIRNYAVSSKNISKIIEGSKIEDINCYAFTPMLGKTIKKQQVENDVVADILNISEKELTSLSNQINGLLRIADSLSGFNHPVVLDAAAKLKNGINGIKDKPIELLQKIHRKSIVKETKKRDVNGISIIITAYKAQEFIEECLDSIQAQSYFADHKYEILLGIDGCRETLEKVKEIQHKYNNLKVYMMDENRGTYITFNTLAELSIYENIIRFDSDDIMCENMVAKIMEFSDKFNVIRFYFSDFGDVKDRQLIYAANGCLFFKYSLFEELGGYKPWICSADLDFLKRAAGIMKEMIITEPLFKRRVIDSSLSGLYDGSKIRDFYNDLAKSEDVMKVDRVTNQYYQIVVDITATKVREIENKQGISIVISAYKAEEFIEECLDSIQNQTYFKNFNDYEILVGVDGCEKTLEKLKEIEHKYKNLRVFWIEKNGGPYIVFNTLVSRSLYSSISIFGADDIMKEFFIEENYKHLTNDNFVIAKCDNFNHPNTKDITRTYNPDGVIIFNKSDFIQVNGCEDWRCGADSDLLRRFNLKGLQRFNSDAVTMLRRIHDNNLTKNFKLGFGSKYRNDINKIHTERKKAELDNYKKCEMKKIINNSIIYNYYELVNSNFPQLSVALPIYNGKQITWLALESLCNQEQINFNWELIICEENYQDSVGFDEIRKYKERLNKAGCCRILYISVNKKILLVDKWQIIGENISSTSKCFVLHAADCYSPSLRLHLTYENVVKNGIDWYDFKKGYFYSLISNRIILYDFEGKTNLNMSFNSIFAKNIPYSELKRGIDAFLYSHCENSKSDFHYKHDDILLYDSLDTHGVNSISLSREKLFDTRPDIFKQTNLSIDDLKIEKNLIEKLKKLRNINKKIQCRVSQGVIAFKDKLFTKYNFIDYYDEKLPTVFFGLYRQEDYIALINHKNKVVIIWCGSDSLVIKEENVDFLLNEKITHIAMSEFISKDLQKFKIPHKIIPITPTDSTLLPCERGDNIYVYSSLTNPNFYGKNLIDEIQKRLKHKIIIAHKNTYTTEELINIYKSCFIGLRLTQHDGLPNTVVELGLMGRRCIYNGKLPNSISWTNVDDICESIEKEYENRHTNDVQIIHNDIKKYINTDKEWIKELEILFETGINLKNKINI